MSLTTQTTQPIAPAVNVNHAALWTREQIDVIKETVAKGATDAQLQMFLALAARYQLDPFAKELWCVNMGGGMTIMASRDGYLKAAQRDPDFRGLKAFVVKEGDEFSIDPVNDTVHHKFGAKRGAIQGAWAIAYHAQRQPVICWAEFAEYNKANSVWKQYPSAMIQKVAEVMALKRQFGINGLVTQEEVGPADEQPQYSAGPTINTQTGEVLPPAPLAPAPVAAPEVTSKQMNLMGLEAERVYGRGWEKDESLGAIARNQLETLTGKRSRTQLTKSEASTYIDWLKAQPTYTEPAFTQAPAIDVASEPVFQD